MGVWTASCAQKRPRQCFASTNLNHKSHNDDHHHGHQQGNNTIAGQKMVPHTHLPANPSPLLQTIPSKNLSPSSLLGSTLFLFAPVFCGLLLAWTRRETNITAFLVYKIHLRCADCARPYGYVRACTPLPVSDFDNNNEQQYLSKTLSFQTPTSLVVVAMYVGVVVMSAIAVRWWWRPV